MADPIELQKNKLPPSLYAETAREAVATLPLRGDKRAGVVVVGGGFTGLSTALHLAQRGADVTVLEAREPGWGASGRNGGQVNPGLKHEPEEIERHFGRDLGRRMVSLSGGAPDRVFSLIRELQIRCEANQGGTIRAAFSKRSETFLRRATAGWRDRGAPVELLEGEAIARATAEEKRAVPAPIRGQTIPIAKSRSDVIGNDRACTGKTLRPRPTNPPSPRRGRAATGTQRAIAYVAFLRSPGTRREQAQCSPRAANRDAR